VVPPAIIAGRYQVRKKLGGASSQGEVYEVDDTYEGGVVALKLLTSMPPGGPWAEAQILRHLADPHILPIRNADHASGQPYVVTELARHGTVEDLIKAAGDCGLPVDDVVRWTRHACYGVARGHDVRLVHNDIKPGNLFLNAEGECLVGDFGFATVIPSGAHSVMPYGATAETAAPEVAARWNTPAASASVASDVYSLGATAYWMLAGRPPIDLTGITDPNARMAAVAAGTPPRLRDVAPHVPPHVASVIEKAMAPNPADRYPSVTALAAALGTRPPRTRHWRRTDEHAGHLACWRGEPNSKGGTYLVCMEPGPRPAQRIITTTHAGSGHRLRRGCRTVFTRLWAQGVRSVMRDLS
jgi:serine/threonine-protein kinase